tara:strand:+ start:248 stop:760 length:513 start_codon:yes stop_codon:yes gene_type:complete
MEPEMNDTTRSSSSSSFSDVFTFPFPVPGTNDDGSAAPIDDLNVVVDVAALNLQLAQLREETRQARVAIRQLRTENTTTVTMLGAVTSLATNTNNWVQEHDAFLRAFISTCMVLWTFLNSLRQFVASLPVSLVPPPTLDRCPVLQLYEQTMQRAPTHRCQQRAPTHGRQQ